MLTANVCAADFLLRSKHPSLYRVHEGPTPEKLVNLKNFLKSLSLTLGGGEDPTAQDYADLVASIAGRPDRDLLQSMILRSMQQAVYGPHNVGHFGLAYEAYTHFTSPIRRYPDLLVHRVIKALLAKQDYAPPRIDERDEGIKPVKKGSALPQAKKLAGAQETVQAGSRLAAKVSKAESLALWEQLGTWLSSTERRADEASRDVEAWLKCFFMKEKVGDAFSGRITGVAPFGVFVTLDALFVEGLVHVSELGNEYFQYNESMHELRGERSGRRYQLTDSINVQVARVDLEARRIEFRLVQGTTLKDILRDAKALPHVARKPGSGSKKKLDADIEPLAPVFPPETALGEKPGKRGENKRKAAETSRERTNAQKKRKASIAVQQLAPKAGSKTKSKTAAVRKR
jgi:ribonuclease R